jgi:hypothetical protein
MCHYLGNYPSPRKNTTILCVNDVTLFDCYITLWGLTKATFAFVNKFSNPLTIINFKMMKKAGILIILIGVALIILTSFTSFTDDILTNKLVETATNNKTFYFNWYPLVGVALLGIGAFVLEKSSDK